MAHHNRVADLRGASRLAVDATTRVTRIVEAMHRSISPPSALAAGLVYFCIREIAGLVGGGVDRVLAPLERAAGDHPSSREREVVLAVLNGLVGDHLEATANPLALAMRLRREGRPLAPAEVGTHALLFIHGSCMSDLQWGHAGLAEAHGLTAAHLSYNSGLHISRNGRALADLLEDLVRRAPVAELAIVAHSMGGLVARSACHHGAVAGHAWPRRLRKLFFLGTPHLGAPLERHGSVLHEGLGWLPYAAPLATLGRIRSAGITDLRHGNLVDEDWAGLDRFARAARRPRPVPLPAGVACHAVAAGADRLVPTDSALGRHSDPARALAFPASRQWVAPGLSHMDLVARPEVTEQLARWLALP